MNKLRYRIVFNKVRGILMVVAENARSSGKGVGEGGPGGQPGGAGRTSPALLGTARAIAAAFGTAALLLPIAASAQVVADPGAPGGQRPTVLTTANGVIQVNVQTASAAGVSRNTYSQFDVPKGGVILNNARVDTQTQTGGWVQGNPWLAGGSARVILNEVNSSNPSRLQGYIEVAGARAEVIVANPAGISVNGGGFINASRATLTTGSARMSDGRLTGFNVARGQIDIEGEGLDASTADYAALIARSVVLNGAVWARQLNVVHGSAEVDAAGDTSVAAAGDGPAPAFGIDVRQLGGMYANQIFLVGSEAGVGVRNAGEIGAAAGELVVTADGRIENSGRLSGAQQVRLSARGVDNSGVLTGDAGVTVASESLRNSGSIGSTVQAKLTVSDDLHNTGGTIQAQRVELTSATGTITNLGGKIVQTGSTGLDIAAPRLVNANGGQIGTPHPVAAPAAPVGAGSSTDNSAGGAGDATQNATPSPVTGQDNATTPQESAPLTVLPNGTIRAAQAIDNSGGQITAGGDIGVQAGQFDNSGGLLYLRELSFRGNAFVNRGGTVDVAQRFQAATPVFDNSGGTVLVGGAFSGVLGQFDNAGGTLQANSLEIETMLNLDNTGGMLRQAGKGTAAFSIARSFHNDRGTIDSAGAIALTAATFDGSAGKLVSQGDFTLETGATRAYGTTWQIGGTATLRADAFDHSGLISAGQDLVLGGGAARSSGTLYAASNLRIDSATLDNAGGTFAARGRVSLSAAGGLNNSGTIDSGAALDIELGDGDLDNSGTIVAAGPARIAAAGIDNDGGHIATAAGSGAGLTLTARSLGNRGGSIAGAAATAITADSIVNDGGQIGTAAGSGGDLSIATGSLSNKGGTIVADGNAAIGASGAVDNGDGTVQAKRSVQLGAGAEFNNNGGSVEALGAQGSLSLAAGAITSEAGRIVNAGTGLTSVTAQAGLSNSGTLAGNGDLVLAAQTLQNKLGGKVSAMGALDLAASGSLVNAGAIAGNRGVTLDDSRAAVHNTGSIDAAGALTLRAASIANDSGRIASGTDLVLASGILSNTGGTVLASGPAGSLAIQAATIDNLGGRIENAGLGSSRIAASAELVNSGAITARGALDLAAAGVDNRVGGAITASGLGIAVQQRLVNSGTIGSSAGFDLQAAGASIGNSGQIVANGPVTVAAGAFDNGGGQLATAGGSGADLTLTTGSLSNQRGTILADRDTVIVASGAVDNAHGTIQAGNALGLTAGAALVNSEGVIEAAGAGVAMQVAAASIDNSGGRIVNAGTGDTNVDGGTSLLNSGTISGAGRLVLSAHSLQNNTGGVLSSGGDLALVAAGRFANTGGTVSSGGTLTFDQASASFANSGTMVSAGLASIVAATIDNDRGQLATLKSSGAAISLRAAGMSNRAGTILADGDASLLLGGALQNGGGTLQAGGNVNVAAAGAVHNDAGTIEALGAGSTLALDAQALANGTGKISNVGTGDTVIGVQGDVTNNGLIAGNGKLAINGATLQNQANGAIGAGRDLGLNLWQRLDNQGKISSGGTLTFNQAGATMNNSGQLTSQGATVIRAAAITNLGGQIATVKGSGSDIVLTGALNNRAGRVLADGNATLASTGGLDNTGGTLQAGKDMSLSANGGLSNGGGVIETLGATSALAAQAQWIDNGSGRIANVGNRDTRLSGASIASSGAIGGNGNLILSSQTLSNQAGSISAGGNLDLAVNQQLENRGTIDSAGTLTFNQAGANFINSGQVTAGGSAVIAASQLINSWGKIGAGADLTVTAQVLVNEGGSIAAERDLRVATHEMLGTGDVYGGRDLFLSMDGDYAQAGGVQRYRAQRDLSFSITGNFTNTATFEAVRNLDLSAAYVANGAGAVIRAEGIRITSAGGISNAGEINGQGALDLITGGNIDNSNGIVGGYVRLTAQNLNNTGASALVGATDGMELAIGDQLANRGGATLYSAGNLSATAGTLNNYSSTVEAAGNLGITAGTINNVRENIAIVQAKTLDETHHMVLPSWYSHGGNRNYYDPSSANYQPFETYFVNPADIIEDGTFITPDGYTIGRVVIRTHANDSAFFAAGSGAYGNYGHRERIQTTDGTRTLYYLARVDNLANPDQGGALENGNPLFGSTTMEWDGPPVSFSSMYGSCVDNCVRFTTETSYDDPAGTIARAHVRELAPNHAKLEMWRDAHHTVVEDSLAPGAGAAAQIRSGGNMQLTVGQQLNNTFGEIIAAGYLGVDGGGTRTNQAATLYRHHSFDGRWQVVDGTMATYTMPTISEVTGSVGGVMSGGLGVSITGRSFSNVDVTAGTVGIVRTAVNVLGSGTAGAGAAGSGAAASGIGNSAGLKGIFGGAFVNAAAAASAGGGAGEVSTVGAAAAGALASVRTSASAIGSAPDVTAGVGSGAMPAAAAGQAGVLKITPSGLFKKNPDVNASYLLETRPQFANLENWTSSDYLFQQLGNDPALTQKRLGDGFYEQRMVREQLAQLTGRPPQGGGSDDSRYQQLLNNAVSFAREYDLRPGVALSAAQVSHLTSDIVWMEPQQVSLPDGSVETVLVPKVYLAHVGRDAVKASGALVTGAGVDIRTDEDIVNRGGVIDGGAGRTLLLAGRDIVNEGGSIKGNDVLLAAVRDVRNESLSATQVFADRQSSGSYTSMSSQASITAAGVLQVQAGRDFHDVAGKIDAGSASISAARDISFGALATGSTYQHAIGEYKQNDSTLTHAVSQLATAGDLTLAAGRDLTFSGVQAAIGGDGLLLAGRALNVGSVTDEVKTDQHNDPASKTYDKRVQENQTVVGSSIGAQGDLKLRAGINETASLTLSASGVAAGGAVSLGASGDVNIEGAQEKHLLDFASHSESGNALKKSSSTTSDYLASTTVIGSSVNGGSVAIAAGNDVRITGSELVADKALTLAAGRDLLVASAVQVDDERHSAQSKKSGFSLSAVEGVGYSKSQQAQNSSVHSTTQLGSTLSGDSIVAIAGRDMSVQASNVVADGDIVLVAARDLSIVSAQETRATESASSSTKSGSIGTAWQPALGTVKTTEDGTSHSLTQVGSQVGSIGGNVSIEAGERYTQTASGVLAQGGDIGIQAKDVLINAGDNLSDSTSHSTFSKVALGGTVSIPLVNAVQGIASLASAAKQSGDGRMTALAAMTGAANATQAVENINPDNLAAGIKVSVSLGSTKSENNVVQTSSTAVGSQVLAGGDVSIVATGGDKASNINAVGSAISAGGDATLRADNEVNLLAAENTFSQHSTNNSSGASIGIGFTFGGAQQGFTLDLAVSKAKGRADGDDLSYTNTQLSVGGNVALYSGGDTTLKGGVITAATVRADIGDDLKIESLQDRATYDSKQTSAGLNASLCIPPFCYGASTVGGSFSKSAVNGDFLSVLEQSGIKAGDGGFQILVGGNTDLKGGILVGSDDSARNLLSTGTLTASDLVNHSSADASSIGMGLSLSSDQNFGKYEVGKALVANAMNNGSQERSADGQTKATIGSAAIIVRDEKSQINLTGKDVATTLTGVSRDVTNGNGTVEKQDLQAIQADARIRQEFSNMLTSKTFEYTDQANKILFETENKIYRVTCSGAATDCLNDKSKIKIEEVDKKVAAEDGSVIAVNGIMNDNTRAAELAYQNAPVTGGAKPKSIILMHIPKTEDGIADIMVAAYEKNLAPIFGYSNADVEYAELLKSRGEQTTLSLGHSRGTIVQYSALNILRQENITNSNLSVTGVGGAVLASSYFDVAKSVNNYGERYATGNVDYVFMKNDPVPVLAGLNGFVGDGNPFQSLLEFKNVYLYDNSAHSCYGSGAKGCKAIPSPVTGAFSPMTIEGVIWYHNGLKNSGK